MRFPQSWSHLANGCPDRSICHSSESAHTHTHERHTPQSYTTWLKMTSQTAHIYFCHSDDSKNTAYEGGITPAPSFLTRTEHRPIGLDDWLHFLNTQINNHLPLLINHFFEGLWALFIFIHQKAFPVTSEPECQTDRVGQTGFWGACSI